MKNFLKDTKGETLVETLAAILIFTMASIVLYSMVTSASRINIEAREKDELIERQLMVAERADETAPEGQKILGTVKMTITASDGEKDVSNFDVNFFRTTEDDSIYSYYKK